MANTRRYVFTGGGTGGHVVPNLAMIAELREQDPDAEILYLGLKTGAEARLVKEAGLRFETIRAQAFVSPRRLGPFLVFLAALFAGCLKSLWILRRFRPSVVIATGGYVSVPVVLAAALLRRPIYLQEQNVRPGKANLFLARFAAKIGVSFRETLECFKPGLAEFVGYPLRRRLASADRADARRRLSIPENHRVAFVVGGSMGARSINRATVDSLSNLLADEEISLIHSTGLYSTAEYRAFEDTQERVGGTTLSEKTLSRYHIRKFFDKVEDAYAAADLVVARAGAGTVMELALLGKPAILIPKLDTPDAHQLHNALSLKEAGSAEVLYEEVSNEGRGSVSRVRSDELSRCVRDLLRDDDKRRNMAESARGLIVPDATQRNVALILRLASVEDNPVRTTSEFVVGQLTSSRSGVSQELIFQTSTIGERWTADVQLGASSGQAQALIRRFGTAAKDVRFEIFPRRGIIQVDDEILHAPVILKEGSVLRFGDESYRFSTHTSTIEQVPVEGNILSRVFTVGLGTTLSRVLGLAREIVMAASFGTGRVMDVFAASLTVSNLFRRIFAEYAVDAAFLPTYLTLFRQGRKEAASRLLRTVLTVSLLATTLITIIGIVSAPIWLPWIVWGFAAKGMSDETVYLTRWMMPYLVLVTVASIFGAVLKAHNRFAATSYSTVMFSVGIIAGSLLYPMFGPTALGLGVLMGGIGQILFHLPSLFRGRFLKKHGLSLKPLLAVQEPGMRKIRATAPKIVADVTITKLDSIISTAIVSTLAIGHTSVLYFGLLMVQLPFALISQSLNTVILKEFSESLALRDLGRMRRLIVSSIHWNIFLLLPVAACLIVLGRPIIDLLFNYRNFTSVDMTATAMGCYAVGLVGWGIHGLMGRLYAARLEAGRAMFTNLAGAALSIVLSLAFVRLGLSYAGVALGTSLAFLGNAGFRLFDLKQRLNRDGVDLEWTELRQAFIRTGIATLAASLMAFLTWLSVRGFDGFGVFLSRAIVLVVPLTSGILTFVTSALILRCPEMDDLTARVRRFLPRRGGPAPLDLKTPVNFQGISSAHFLRAAEDPRVEIPLAQLARRCKTLFEAKRWQDVNIAVKIVGARRVAAFRYNLCDIVLDRTKDTALRRFLGGDYVYPGFVRRNAVQALATLGPPDEQVESALRAGLDDPYFEVRTAAAKTIAMLAPQLTPTTAVDCYAVLSRLIFDKNFETAMHAVRAFQALAWDRSVTDLLRKLHYHPNWRVRSEVVKAYYELYKRGVVEDRETILSYVDDVLVTCDAFRPIFELKENLRIVRSGLIGASTRARPEAGAQEKEATA